MFDLVGGCSGTDRTNMSTMLKSFFKNRLYSRYVASDLTATHVFIVPPTPHHHHLGSLTSQHKIFF